MVRALSNVTVTLAERSSVLKSATLVLPDAIWPPLQFVVAPQLPSAVEIQRPLLLANGVALASGELPLAPLVPAAVTM